MPSLTIPDELFERLAKRAAALDVIVEELLAPLPATRGFDMNAAETIEIAAVVKRVQGWPAPMRIALARQVLETLEAPLAPPSQLPRGPSAAEVAALFKADKPAPDDATVEQWIDDYRMEKYGK
jgi:hypothetical protein